MNARRPAPQRLCAWCETSGPAGVACANCGVAFPDPNQQLPRPPAPDRYNAAERAAFSTLDQALKTVGTL